MFIALGLGYMVKGSNEKARSGMSLTSFFLLELYMCRCVENTTRLSKVVMKKVCLRYDFFFDE